MGIIDGWYVDAADPETSDRWIYEAVENTQTQDWPDGEHCCEALGPKIQGNPLALSEHRCVPFNLQVPVYGELPRTFEGLSEVLPTLESKFVPGAVTEGVVFHHPDGRRAKIKGKDFRRTG